MKNSSKLFVYAKKDRTQQQKLWNFEKKNPEKIEKNSKKLKYYLKNRIGD